MARQMMRVFVAALLLLWACPVLAAPPQTGSAQAGSAQAGSAQAVPVKGMVTLVDLGAKTCIPCKMMAPILVELEKDYRGKAAVVFLDVRENDAPARRFGIRAIPTQIFFDKTGKEVARHEGFLDKKAIADQLDKLLAK